MNSDRACVTSDQIEFYRTEGYLVIERFFSRDMLAGIDLAIGELTQRAEADPQQRDILEWEPQLVDGRRVPRRIYRPFEQHETFRQVASDAHLLDCVESLIGPDINLQHSKLNMKLAKVGSVVEWHQDLAYFPHTNDDLVTLLIYLDDATIENGCLRVLPRHHTHYFGHHLPDGRFAGMITDDIDSERWGRVVPLAAPAGSVIFMHCLTPHASSPNQSDKARRTLIFEYRAADALPIYFGPQTPVAESTLHVLRGEPARFARFGGPPPLIPDIGEARSLYELQARSKSTTMG